MFKKFVHICLVKKKRSLFQSALVVPMNKHNHFNGKFWISVAQQHFNVSVLYRQKYREMTKITSLIINTSIILLLLCGNFVKSTPMLYKKNTQDIYEPDLVAVSSTVIPLSVLEVSYGVGGKPSESYKQAVLKKLRKKVQHAGEVGNAEEIENPDTLITVKTQKQHREGNDKTKVKGITSSN